jgi:opacity protein-like surface antigen
MRPIGVLATALVAVLAPGGPAHAQAQGLTGVDIMTSTVMQEGQSSFSGLGARVRVHPAQLVQQVEVLPYVEYWRNSSTVQPYDIRSTRKDATLGVDARFTFTEHAWQPYVGAGWGLHFLSSRVQAPLLGVNDAKDSLMKGGLSVLGGINFALNEKIDNFVELKYHHVTDYKQLKFNWGLSFKL